MDTPLFSPIDVVHDKDVPLNRFFSVSRKSGLLREHRFGICGRLEIATVLNRGGLVFNRK